MYAKDKITEIFVVVDDFCKNFSSEIKNIKYAALPSDKKRRNRAVKMADSEILLFLQGSTKPLSIISTSGSAALGRFVSQSSFL